jgi:hypothetical protein
MATKHPRPSDSPTDGEISSKRIMEVVLQQNATIQLLLQKFDTQQKQFTEYIAKTDDRFDKLLKLITDMQQKQTEHQPGPAPPGHPPVPPPVGASRFEQQIADQRALKKELELQESKQNNLVLIGLPEEESPTVLDRNDRSNEAKNPELKKIRDMADTIGLVKGNVLQVFRMGALPSHADVVAGGVKAKTRPLKIILEDQATKSGFIKNREALNQIVIDPNNGRTMARPFFRNDLTPFQRRRLHDANVALDTYARNHALARDRLTIRHNENDVPGVYVKFRNKKPKFIVHPDALILDPPDLLDCFKRNLAL